MNLSQFSRTSPELLPGEALRQLLPPYVVGGKGEVVVVRAGLGGPGWEERSAIGYSTEHKPCASLRISMGQPEDERATPKPSAELDHKPAKRHKPPSRLGKGPTAGSWKPGQSGNYKGGPRSGLALATAIRERIDPHKVLDIVVAFIDDETIAHAEKLALLLPWLHAGFLKPPTSAALHVTSDADKLDGARLLGALSEGTLRELLECQDRLETTDIGAPTDEEDQEVTP